DHLGPDPSKGEARQVVITMRAKSIIFATGAIERPLIFANNDRPGVMLASAVRTYLNRFAIAPGRHALIVTNNSSAYGAALDLARAGLKVVIADMRSAVDDALNARAKERGIHVLHQNSIRDVGGRLGVDSVVLSSGQRIECDVIAMSGGWSPAVHLTSHTGIK